MIEFGRHAVGRGNPRPGMLFKQGFVGSHGFVDAHAFRNGHQGEPGRGRIAQHPTDVQDAAETFQFFLHGVAFLSSEEHRANATRDAHQAKQSSDHASISSGKKGNGGYDPLGRCRTPPRPTLKVLDVFEKFVKGERFVQSQGEGGQTVLMSDLTSSNSSLAEGSSIMPSPQMVLPCCRPCC